MAKPKDDSDILKTIIAKSTNKEYIGIAQAELGALKERKAAIAAAIQPALDVPQIVANPKGVASTLADENVSKDIRSIKKDMSLLLEEAKTSRKLLDGILKTNQKYYESNSELIDRLMMASGLSKEQMEEMARLKRAQQGQGKTGAVGPDTGDNTGDDSQGGGLLGGLLGGGLVAGLTSLLGRKKTPKPDVDGKKRRPGGPSEKEPKGKAKGKGGRLAKLYALAAIGIFGGLQAWDFLTDEDAEWSDLVPDIVKDNVPENVINAAPDAALAVGLQAPTILDAVRRSSSSEVPKGTPLAPSEKPPVGTNKPAGPPKTPPKGSSQAQDIWNSRARRASEKEILEATTEKIGKSTLKSALKKIPIVSLLAGLGFGSYRYLWEGDTVGAGLEVGSGAVATVPGIGTVGSIAVDVATLMRDIYSSVYGTWPEEDVMASERFEDLKNVVMKYLDQYYNTPAAETAPQSNIEMPMGGADDFASAIAATTSTNIPETTVAPTSENYAGAADDLAGAIAATTNAQTETDISSKKNMSRAEYLTNAATPIQRMTPDKLNTINNAGNNTSPNIVINKQGDTITKVINGGTGGGGTPPVAGSPSKIPSPFDYILYGDTYNWGY